MRRRLTAIGALIAMLVALAPASASACSCAVPELSTIVDDTTVVFTGVQIDEFQDGNSRVLLVEPFEVFVGEVTDPVELNTAADSAGCGISFADAGEVGIVAFSNPAGLSVNLCSSWWDPAELVAFFEGGVFDGGVREGPDTVIDDVTDGTTFDTVPPEEIDPFIDEGDHEITDVSVIEEVRALGADDEPASSRDFSVLVWGLVVVAILGVFVVGARGPKPFQPDDD